MRVGNRTGTYIVKDTKAVAWGFFIFFILNFFAFYNFEKATLLPLFLASVLTWTIYVSWSCHFFCNSSNSGSLVKRKTQKYTNNNLLVAGKASV